MSKNPGFGTSYSYDGHGNILSLSRGKVDGSSDLLTMSYIGNRLHGMTDGNGGSLIPESLAVTLPAGTEHYAYDANGNMTRDHVSGITAMSYNRINLPETITVVDSGKVSNVSYSYTSDGTKQRASVTDASGESLTKDWCSNLVYLNGELDRILIPGGYIKDGSYRFFLTDHLGSVRAVADSEGNVLETIDYYPYGQEISDGTTSGNGAAVVADGPDEPLQPYRFNGKESQAFAGLPYLDYGARFYHPQSTRWTTMDPLAEKYYFLSPYVFCSNNPVNFVDWNGEDIWDVHEDGSITWVKQSRRDVVRTVDANGDIVSRKSFKKTDLSKGTLNVGERSYDYFTVSDAGIAQKLFEFLATPSNWGKDNNTNDRQAIVESSVIYTNMGNAVLIGEKEATPTASLSMEYINQGAVFSRIDHVHPNNNPSPSGTGQKNADIGTIFYLDKNGIKFSTPEWDRYHIFTPKDKQYHAYDGYTTDMISPAVFSVKKKKKR